jgi:hypothetical protein
MRGRPQESEAASFYWKYIDKVEGDDPISALEQQLPKAMALFEGISEERSMYRYAPEKWTIRQSLNHTTDTERAFTFRALWFGRGFTGALESFDEGIAAVGAEADRVSWAAHVEEYRQVRMATISLFRHMPEEAWLRTGVASGHVVSVRALAFLTAGHTAHHLAILRERYLGERH